MRYEVTLRFVVSHELPPPTTVLHDALEHVEGLIIEAATAELAEHYADVIRVALERAADRVDPA